MVDHGARMSPFGESSYFFGSNIPGKPRKYLLNSGGRPKLFAVDRRRARARLRRVHAVTLLRGRRARTLERPSED